MQLTPAPDWLGHPQGGSPPQRPPDSSPALGMWSTHATRGSTPPQRSRAAPRRRRTKPQATLPALTHRVPSRHGTSCGQPPRKGCREQLSRPCHGSADPKQLRRCRCNLPGLSEACFLYLLSTGFSYLRFVRGRSRSRSDSHGRSHGSGRSRRWPTPPVPAPASVPAPVPAPCSSSCAIPVPLVRRRPGDPKTPEEAQSCTVTAGRAQRHGNV